MFTGIIKELGEIIKIEEKNKIKTFVVKASVVIDNKKIGDSIAVNGACMTITKIDKNSFQFDTIQESLEKTNLADLKPGDIVNLEPALALNQGLDGHLVQGHIDTTAEVNEVIKNGDNTEISIKIPKEIKKYLAFKGSITINGVSLTISRLEESIFKISLIPHTLEQTNLKQLNKGSKVNLEIDLIARYLESLLEEKEKETKYEFLRERNLI